MTSNEERIAELKQKAYDPVYIWDAKPHEEDADHSHMFDTHLIVLDGQLEIRIDNKITILKSSDQINIPRETIHYSKAGKEGCKYIVGEKH